MTKKLTQKHLLKGTQSFEILDEQIIVRHQPRFKKEEETLNVMLTVLNPEPVINQSSLDFVSRVNGEALVSLYLGKPNAEEFNAFVATLKQRAHEAYNAFIGISSNVPLQKNANVQERIKAGGIAANMFEEPSAVEDFNAQNAANIRQEVNAKRLDEALEMLERHMDTSDIPELIAALKALQANPKNEACFVDVVNTFNALGFRQGAVLTYAPYISVLFSDDPFGTR